MDQLVQFLTAQLLAVTAILWGLCQMAKSLAPARWRLFKRVLPWLPILGGALFGLVFPSVLPASFGVGRVAAATYFACSGVGAILFHTMVYQPFAKKAGAK